MAKSAEVSKATRRSRPQEVSSRVQVAIGGLRKAGCARPKARDPRMDGVSAGAFNAGKCAQAYAFIEELRGAEKAALRGRKDDEEAREVLRKMENQDRQRERLGEMQKAKNSLRTSEGMKIQETGKTPFYHSKEKIKNTMLTRKFENLGKHGNIDDTIAKKRRHLDAKEKKVFVPRVRRSAEK